MSHPGKHVTVSVDGTQQFQKIDGFGVNINSRYFDSRLMPAMDRLVNDLGATLYRVDIWGKSNWIDPSGEMGRAALDPIHQAKILDGEIFRRGWGMLRWLNQHGIRPYLTASGIVPPWMLASDGKTLADYDGFTDMLAEMLDWARNKEQLDFNLFGPMNETDIGAPEGPTVSAADYVTVCELLMDKLDARGLGDIQLVVAEQANLNPAYLQELTCSEKLRGRIGVFGLHVYVEISPERYQQVTALVENSPYAGTPLWMTEYGDLEQSGEREWYVAWMMTSRLIDFLEAGFNGGMVWDAYDNYHDHDEHWTIYGLLRTGLRVHTPKKRYYASRQVFRFVRPGMVRIAADCSTPGMRVLAFASPDGKDLTLVAANDNPTSARVNIAVKGLNEALNASSLGYYRTSETENCIRLADIPFKGANWPFTGIDTEVPPASIVTLTTQNA
jgi:O-glycosyl hydrolase